MVYLSVRRKGPESRVKSLSILKDLPLDSGPNISIRIFFLPVKNVQTRVESMLEVVPLVLEFVVHVRYQKLLIKLLKVTKGKTKSQSE